VNSGGPFIRPPAGDGNFPGIIGALLLRLYPEAAQRGADVVITPDELDRLRGWSVLVYTGIGIGVRPPLRVTMQRPKATVGGVVVDNDGEPGGAGEPPRALPPGS
jgi:hypothetical protein